MYIRNGGEEKHACVGSKHISLTCLSQRATKLLVLLA